MRVGKGAARRRQRRPAPPRRVLIVAALCLLLAVSGCTSSAGPRRSGTPATPTSQGVTSATSSSSGASTSTAPATSPTTASGAVTLAYGDNGHTVRASVGQTVHVVLENTYWTIDGSSDDSVVEPRGTASHSPQPNGCVPGAGCGTVHQDFLARTPGQARLSAHRTTCGEAMACAPAQRSFSVTVVVE
jgi:hypothetical protein